MADGEFAEIAESDRMSPNGRGRTHVVFNIGAANAKEYAELATDRRIENSDEVDSRDDDDFSMSTHGMTIDEAAVNIGEHNLAEQGYEISNVACTRSRTPGWYDSVGEGEYRIGEREGFKCVAGKR